MCPCECLCVCELGIIRILAAGFVLEAPGISTSVTAIHCAVFFLLFCDAVTAVEELCVGEKIAQC